MSANPQQPQSPQSDPGIITGSLDDLPDSATLGSDPASELSKIAHGYGLKLSSAGRTMAENRAAHGAANSYHLEGAGYDFKGSAASMKAFAEHLRDTYGPSLRELYHDPIGGWKNGQSIGAIGGHSNHVHVAAYPQIEGNLADLPEDESAIQAQQPGAEQQRVAGLLSDLKAANPQPVGQAANLPEEPIKLKSAPAEAPLSEPSPFIPSPLIQQKPSAAGQPSGESEGGFKSKTYQADVGDLVDSTPDGVKLKAGVTPEQFLRSLYQNAASSVGFTPDAADRYMKQYGEQPIGRFFQGVDPRNAALGVERILSQIAPTPPGSRPSFQFVLTPHDQAALKSFLIPEQAEQQANLERDIAAEKAGWQDKAARAILPLTPGVSAVAPILGMISPGAAKNVNQFQEELLKNLTRGYVDPTTAGRGEGEQYTTPGAKAGEFIGQVGPYAAAAALAPGLLPAMAPAAANLFGGAAAMAASPALERGAGNFEARANALLRAYPAAAGMTLAGGLSGLPWLSRLAERPIAGAILRAAESGTGFAAAKPLTTGESPDWRDFATGAVISLAHSIASANGRPKSPQVGDFIEARQRLSLPPAPVEVLEQLGRGRAVSSEPVGPFKGGKEGYVAQYPAARYGRPNLDVVGKGSEGTEIPAALKVQPGAQPEAATPPPVKPADVIYHRDTGLPLLRVGEEGNAWVVKNPRTGNTYPMAKALVEEPAWQMYLKGSGEPLNVRRVLPDGTVEAWHEDGGLERFDPRWLDKEKPEWRREISVPYSTKENAEAAAARYEVAHPGTTTEVRPATSGRGYQWFWKEGKPAGQSKAQTLPPPAEATTDTAQLVADAQDKIRQGVILLPEETAAMQAAGLPIPEYAQPRATPPVESISQSQLVMNAARRAAGITGEPNPVTGEPAAHRELKPINAQPIRGEGVTEGAAIPAGREAAQGVPAPAQAAVPPMVAQAAGAAVENVIPRGATPQEAGAALSRKYGAMVKAEDVPGIHREMERSGLDARQKLEAFKAMGLGFRDPVQMAGTVRGIDAASGNQPSAVIKYRSGNRNLDYTVVGRFPGGEKIMVVTPDAQTRIIQSPFGETGNERVTGGADRLAMSRVPEIGWPDVGLLSDVHPTMADVRRVNPNATKLSDLSDTELQKHFPQVYKNIHDAEGYIGEKAAKEAVSQGAQENLPEEKVGTAEEPGFVQKSRDWLRDWNSGGNLGAGQQVIPAIYHTGVVVGWEAMKAGKYAYGKAEDFAAWSKDMVGRLGDRVKPYLDEIWGKVNQQGPQWFSPLENAVKLRMPSKASAEQVKSVLRSGGFITKGEGGTERPNNEAHWTGLYDFLQRKSSAKEPVTKQEVLDFLAKNGVELQERQFHSERIEPTIQQENAVMDWVKDNLMGNQEAWQDAAWNLQSIRDGHRHGIGNLEDLGVPDNLLDPWRSFLDTKDQTTKFTRFTTPGGTNHRELTLSLPSRKVAVDKLFNESVDQEAPTPGPEHDAWQQRIKEARARLRETADYRPPSGHQYGIPEADTNRIALIRVNDRVGPNGEKILHMDEYQDDLQNQIQNFKAQIKRYQESVDVKSVEAAQKEIERLESLLPFRGKSHELAMKRVLDYGVRNGYDKISWATGQQVADRYDLARYYSGLSYDPKTEELTVEFQDTSKEPETIKGVNSGKLVDYVGKDTATKLLDDINKNSYGEYEMKLSGQIGGAGKHTLYDQLIPNFLSKYTKRRGGKVGTVDIGRDVVADPNDLDMDITGDVVPKKDATVTKEPLHVHSLDITPEMRDSILKTGQPLFGASEGEPPMVVDARARLAESMQGGKWKGQEGFIGEGEGQKRDRDLIDLALVEGWKVLGSGVKKFGGWSNQMVKRLGEQVKPHLGSTWAKVKLLADVDAPNQEGAVSLGGIKIRGVPDEATGTAKEFFDRGGGDYKTFQSYMKVNLGDKYTPALEKNLFRVFQQARPKAAPAAGFSGRRIPIERNEVTDAARRAWDALAEEPPSQPPNQPPGGQAPGMTEESEPMNEQFGQRQGRTPILNFLDGYTKNNLLMSLSPLSHKHGSLIASSITDTLIHPLTTGVDAVMSKVTGGPREVMFDPKGLGRAMKATFSAQEARDLKDILRRGYTQDEAERFLIPNEITGWGPLGAMVNYGRRIWHAGVHPYMTYAFAQTKNNLARIAAKGEAEAGTIDKSQIDARTQEIARGENVSPGAVETMNMYAGIAAAEATFNNENVLSRLWTQFKQLPQYAAKQALRRGDLSTANQLAKMQESWAFTMNRNMPFLRIPVNAVIRTVELDPGAGQALTVLRMASNKMSTGQFFPDRQSRLRFDRAIATIPVGVGLYSLGMIANQHGLMTGLAWQPGLKGQPARQPGSLNVSRLARLVSGGDDQDKNRDDDMWIDVARYTPAGLVMAQGATFNDLRSKSQSQAEAGEAHPSFMSDYLTALTHVVAHVPLVTGMAGFGRAMESVSKGDWGGAVGSGVSSILKSFIPGYATLRDVTGAYEKTIREHVPGASMVLGEPKRPPKDVGYLNKVLHIQKGMAEPTSAGLVEKVRKQYGEPLSELKKEQIKAEDEISEAIKAGKYDDAQRLYERHAKVGTIATGKDEEGDKATVSRINDKANLTPLQYLVKHNRNIDLEAALDAFLDKRATDAERRELAPIVFEKEEAFSKASLGGHLPETKIKMVEEKIKRANEAGIWSMAPQLPKASGQ